MKLAVSALSIAALGGVPIVPLPDQVLITEGGDYMTTEDGFFLEFEL